jgi:hypothetical protein
LLLPELALYSTPSTKAFSSALSGYFSLQTITALEKSGIIALIISSSLFV